MTISRGWRRVATTLLALCAAALPAAASPASATAQTQQSSSYRAMPEPSPVEVARIELASLNVAAPHSMNGYSRTKFPHWAAQGARCDTREVVLRRDGQNVVQDDQCRAVEGTWFSEYDGKTLTSASQVDGDHMVPLAAAWRGGADEWTTPQRKAFANDLDNPQLIAVSATSNRSKGDQTPDLWKPPLKSYWCTYSRAWVDVKHIYNLNVTEAEKNALSEMLDTCA
ncbi:HNH endonuclease family protein [Streptomyces niveus]|uniref:HNH endonuclease family protein n=1 Tax=Streptomyces niveus TaxID=193462 RepID=UPI0036A86DCC